MERIQNMFLYVRIYLCIRTKYLKIDQILQCIIMYRNALNLIIHKLKLLKECTAGSSHVTFTGNVCSFQNPGYSVIKFQRSERQAPTTETKTQRGRRNNTQWSRLSFSLGITPYILREMARNVSGIRRGNRND